MDDGPNGQDRPEAALLAPVPLVLLRQSLKVIEDHGKVAFGSRAWEVFRKLDVEWRGHSIVVYFYASISDRPVGPKVTWSGMYTGHVESVGGAYPGDRDLRPIGDSIEDETGWWAVFWHVTDLHELEAENRIDIADLCRTGTSKRYGKGFKPEGPIIVGHP